MNPTDLFYYFKFLFSETSILGKKPHTMDVKVKSIFQTVLSYLMKKFFSNSRVSRLHIEAKHPIITTKDTGLQIRFVQAKKCKELKQDEEKRNQDF